MKKKICLVMMLMIAMVTLTVTSVFAEPSATMKLTADKTALKEGEEVTVTLEIDSVNEIENGLVACEGNIEYDTNIFEPITSASFQNALNWSGDINPSNNKFATTGSSAGTGLKTGAIFNLKLKVKSSIASKSTTISVKNIKTSDDNNSQVSVPNASVTLNVTGTAGVNTNSGNTAGTQSGIVGNVTNKVSGPDKTTSSKNLPKTGVNQYVVVGIAVVAVIAVVSIVRYKNIIK